MKNKDYEIEFEVDYTYLGSVKVKSKEEVRVLAKVFQHAIFIDQKAMILTNKNGNCDYYDYGKEAWIGTLEHLNKNILNNIKKTC